MRELFLDIETTGLSYESGHRIVEIACLETKNLITTSSFFHKIINPERNVSDEAFKVHGFSSEFLKTKKKFSEVCDEFLEFTKDKKIIAHNARFDIDFLNFELKKLKKKPISYDQVTDSLEIARSRFPGLSNSLDALCKRFGVDLSKRVKHNAMLDCELLREVYINLLDAKEPKLVFDNHNNKTSSPKLANLDYSKKIINLSEDEKKNHDNFLKKEMRKNFY